MEQFDFAGFTFPRNVAWLRRDKPIGHRVYDVYSHAPKPGSNGTSFYLDSDFAPGLRWEWADDIDRRISHRGWYTDDDGDSETIRGFVMHLPKGRGFLAGWSMGNGMASDLEYEIFDTEEEAARRADRNAEIAAEKEREYQHDQDEEDEDEAA